MVRGSFEISRYAGGRPTARQWRCIASPTYSSFIAIKLILTTRPNGRLVTAADTPRTRTIVATPVDEHQHLETKASVLPAGAAVGESAREEVADMRDEKPAAAAPHEAHSHQAKMGTGGTTRQMGPPRLKSRGQSFRQQGHPKPDADSHDYRGGQSRCGKAGTTYLAIPLSTRAPSRHVPPVRLPTDTRGSSPSTPRRFTSSAMTIGTSHVSPLGSRLRLACLPAGKHSLHHH